MGKIQLHCRQDLRDEDSRIVVLDDPFGAGLAHLKSLTQLKELKLEGTKVTDAGVTDYQKARPELKLER